MAGRFESFLLICAPKVTGELGYEEVLRSGFLQRLDAPEFGVKLLHPTQSDALTFPFWVEQGAAAASRIVVRHAALVSRFASPGRDRNLLFLAQPLKRRTPLELQPPHDSKSNYLPGAPTSFNLGRSTLADEAEAGFQRRLYHESPPRSGIDSDRWAVAMEPLPAKPAAKPAAGAKVSAAKPVAGKPAPTKGAETAAEPINPPSGWVNPVILRVDLAGGLFTEASTNYADNDPRAVLHRELLGHFEILALHPILPEEHDARLVAWERLIASQPTNARPNAIERLLLGAIEGPTARSAPLLPKLAAFFSLDALRGQFAVYGHGSPVKPVLSGSSDTLTFTWWPPEDALPPNAAWFASYAERCWARGSRLDQPLAAVAPTPKEGFRFVAGKDRTVFTRAKRFEEPASRLSASRQRWEQCVLTDEALLQSTPSDNEDYLDEDGMLRPQRPDEAWNDVRWIKSCLPLIRREAAVRDFLFSVLSDPRLKGHSILDTVRRSTRDPVQRGDSWISEFNFEQLVETVGRDFVAPLSRVSFEIPVRLAAAGEEGVQVINQRFFDLMNSLNDGGIGLLHGLLQSHRLETNQKNRTKLLLQPSAGWWNDWHLCLFGDPAELEIEFEASGMTLGVSCLGITPLGGSTTGAAIPSVMSFTRPAPREVTGA